jgi:hypothetical protein
MSDRPLTQTKALNFEQIKQDDKIKVRGVHSAICRQQTKVQNILTSATTTSNVPEYSARSRVPKSDPYQGKFFVLK